MYENLLPIGSVVLLSGARTKLMITGRLVTDDKMEKVYDYVGCVYPIGITASDEQIFFDDDAIERLYFIGFQDEEELAFREEVLSQVGELTVKDGQIVPVEE